jgi:hypothetical protein
MEQFFVGLLLILIGLAFTFAGYQLFRVLIPFWGFIAGFSWMADVFALGNGAGFLGTVLGVIIAAIVGLLFAALAYFVYEFAVALFATSVGYWLVAAALIGIGLPFGFFGVLVALIVGLGLAWGTLYYRVPKVLLVLVSAIGGGAIAISGIMLLFGVVPTAILGYGLMDNIIRQSFWWSLTWAGLIIVGLFAQLQLANAMGLASSSYNQYSPTETQNPYAGTKGGSATKKEDSKENKPKNLE